MNACATDFSLHSLEARFEMQYQQEYLAAAATATTAAVGTTMDTVMVT